MIVVHCEAGGRVGLGHLSRCATLCAALTERGVAALLIVESDAAFPELERRAGCRVARAANRGDGIALGDAAAAGAAVLVTDLLGLTAADSDHARGAGFDRLVHLNDSGVGDYRPDLIVDGDLVPGVDAARAGCPVLAGAAWHMIRPDIAALRPDAPWRGDRARRILITLGGADPGRVVEQLLDGLAGTGRAITVVLGAAMGASRGVEIRRRQGGAFQVIDAPDDAGRLMLAHDLIVTLGGLTTYEAMCLGRPVACVAWAHMAPYVERLASAGVAADLGAPAQAAAALRRLAVDGAAPDGTTLASLAAAGWTAVDGGGAGRVAAAIARLADAGA